MYSFLIIFHLILFEYVDRLCGYVNHYEDVSDRCDRQNNCTLDPLLYKERSGVNPCTSNSLYLDITYRCISEEQTLPTHSLLISGAVNGKYPTDL